MHRFIYLVAFNYNITNSSERPFHTNKITHKFWIHTIVFHLIQQKAACWTQRPQHIKRVQCVSTQHTKRVHCVTNPLGFPHYFRAQAAMSPYSLDERLFKSFNFRDCVSQIGTVNTKDCIWVFAVYYILFPRSFLRVFLWYLQSLRRCVSRNPLRFQHWDF